MLLLHQVGSVKIGEVVRYNVTYTPSQDRILPSPERLYVRIRNTSAIALRAAFVHGPYTLSVAAYPSHFDPNERFTNPRRYGAPEFEPMLKAGGSWECELLVPDDIRQGAGLGGHGGFGKSSEHDGECARWVIEVSSQVIFSTSAAVGYEVVVARDRKSLDLSSSFAVVGGQAQAPQPGRVSDHQQSVGAKDGHHAAQPKGVFSRAVYLKVEDTATLWNSPRLPGWDDAGSDRVQKQKQGADEPVESMVKTGDPETKEDKMPRKQKKVHLVVLTHGLHSNLGADMLFMKESIDAAVRQAKIDAKARKAKEREKRRSPASESKASETEAASEGNTVGDEKDLEEEDDDEEVIVRGYSGNATKTERGIKYLGKRLARYVLSMTYPDQPYLPMGKGSGEGFAYNFNDQQQQQRPHHQQPQTQQPQRQQPKRQDSSMPSHKHSSIRTDAAQFHHDLHNRPYKISSISFIAHSLGGLVQTYAVAYIQKHSPDFFNVIEPINFIALATPWLGLSNENPVYVKFALDFGLVGRSGKDLGLAWRTPTIARSGWGAIVSNLGETAHKKVYGEPQPESKPLLRILPTGPAHTALKKFRNRTVYSNVVNDGIVPLRTSCLLFLDWQGLGRVEKARRDAGLVETMVGFGWAELTGANVVSPRPKQQHVSADDEAMDSDATGSRDDMKQVPQPADDALEADDKASLKSVPTPATELPPALTPNEGQTSGPLSGFFNLFKSNDPPKSPVLSPKQQKIFRRGQVRPSDDTSDSASESSRPKVTNGNEFEDENGMMAPPKTTFFESAGDLLNPKFPDVEYLLDPSKRPRTIFHDRVYHPADIPPLPVKRQATSSLMRRRPFSRTSTMTPTSTLSNSSSPYLAPKHEDSTNSAKDYDNADATRPAGEVVDRTNVRVEEKIARGYHRDLSWRKVLVKLEPDAHNNIFVRRMFANAYGWPVMKHMVDVHFSDSSTARMSDDNENVGERARDINQPPDEHGGETKPERASPASVERLAGPEAQVDNGASSDTLDREALDEVTDLPQVQEADMAPGTSATQHRRSETTEGSDSVAWSDRDWADSDSDPESSKGGKDSEAGGRSSSPAWHWTEKIVGKGATKGHGEDGEKHEKDGEGEGA